VPAAQLVLVGSMADDDPEGPAYWKLTERTAEGIPGIRMLSGLDDREVNALQRSADVLMQKSIREGFGLTVSEALWKRRPVIGGRVGGITMQIRQGVDGYLVDSPEEAAARTIDLLHDPETAARMGASGHERVREHFLVTRELEDYLGLLAAGPSL
jgi:trehalose synthase